MAEVSKFKAFWIKVGAVLSALLTVMGVVLGMRRRKQERLKDEFIEKKHEIEKKIAHNEGQEKVVKEEKEKIMKEIQKDAEKIDALKKELKESDASKVDDIEFLKDFVRRHGND